MLISPTFSSRCFDSREARGIALIAVLALISIVSMLIIGFVTMMRLDRTSTASYSQSLKADQLGRGALKLIIGQLQNEMGKDAPPNLTYPNRPLYTNVTSANILPQTVGTNSAMPTLVKISTNAPFYTGASSGALASTAVSSTTPSVNGRSISIARWSQAYLGTFPANANAPYWILMTRSGPTNAAGLPFGAAVANSLNNAASANPNYVVGRVAYAIYDEGRLLDITVAGYPKTGAAALTAAQLQSIKGTLAGADLSVLGIDPNALTAWRNQATATTATSYTNYISSYLSTNAVGAVHPGDTTFLGRQDLINAAKRGTAGLTTAMLTNLTTFTRERNAPSWGPTKNASDLGGNNGAGNIYAYKDKATTATSTNVFIPLIRRTADQPAIKSFRLDGTSYTYPVVAGDPLVYRRFPLDRLKWITPEGPLPGCEDAIQACFGLKWLPSNYTASAMGLLIPNASNFNVWKYVGPTGTTEQKTIKTLAEVLAETPAREPNFFELLQAGILAGSLGTELHLSSGGAVTAFNYNTMHEAAKTLQIFRIGASIISQYEESAKPIVIEYTQSGAQWGKSWNDPWQATGIDNLPYLNWITLLAGAETSNSLRSYLMFGLWNPNQGAVKSRPRVRLRVKGSVCVANNYGKDLIINEQVPFNFPPPNNFLWGHQKNLDATLELASGTPGSGVSGFADAHALLPDDAGDSLATPSTAGMAWEMMPAIQGNYYVAYRLPNIGISATKVGEESTAFWMNVLFNVNSGTTQFFNLWLEYQNAAGAWIPYTYHAGINDYVNTWFTKNPSISASFVGGGLGVVAAPQPIDPLASASNQYFVKQVWELCDPRSLRFNYGQNQTTNSSPAWATFLKSSLWSADTDTVNQALGRKAAQVAQQFFTKPFPAAALSRNNATPAGAQAYPDTDGVQRIADSGLFTAAPSNANAWAGDPYAVSTLRSADRPLILNREFYSIGELGYVCRDDPWKTLNFFTANSGDAALLDLFTVNQSDTPVVAGRVNLNTQNTLVLQSLLSNTITDVVGVSYITKAAQIATDMVAFTKQGSSNGPLVGKDQLATRLLPSLTASDFTGNDDQFIKNRREAVTRALADVGQTRTWNLMIDITAQVGRFPPTATALDQFMVEGERRYWLHVAIDRFTGQVIDQQLEIINQ